MMKYNIEYTCKEHKENILECPDKIIHYNKISKSYGIVIHDGGNSFIKIDFCPWCGKKL